MIASAWVKAARTRAEQAHGLEPAPLAHRVEPVHGLERAYQCGRGFRADDVQAPVDSRSIALLHKA
jgi:hypothetical protein